MPVCVVSEGHCFLAHERILVEVIHSQGRTGMQELVLSGSGFCCLAKSTSPLSQNLFLAKSLLKKKLSMFSAAFWLQMRSSIKAAENWKRKKTKLQPIFLIGTI